MSKMNERKNKLADFILDRRNQMSILRTLYYNGWRCLDLPHNHGTWEWPTRVHHDEKKVGHKGAYKKHKLTYDFRVDDGVASVTLTIVIRADLLDTDIEKLADIMDEGEHWNEGDLNDGRDVKVVLTHSPRDSYPNWSHDKRINIVQIPSAAKCDDDQRIKSLEKAASVMTNAMVKIP